MNAKNSYHKFLTIILSAISLMLAPTVFAGDDHDHGDHSDENDKHGHAHEEKIAGPNGGRIIHTIEPHFELFVRDDRKLQITFLDDENKAIAPQKQVITAITGKRDNPTNMVFKAEEGILLSDKALPEGKSLPIILTLKNTPDSKPHRERFTLNLSECPGCDYKEYACTCEH